MPSPLPIRPAADARSYCASARNSHTAARNAFRIFGGEKRLWRVTVLNSNRAQCIRENTWDVYGVSG